MKLLFHDLEAVLGHPGCPKHVIGIDEVGRGCVAGPVVAGAALFSKQQLLNWTSTENPWQSSVNDSKKIKPSLRQELSVKIQQEALCVGIGEATTDEIDQWNILEATGLAMFRALEKVLNLHAGQQDQAPYLILIDGKFLPKTFSRLSQTVTSQWGVDPVIQCLIGGDSKSFSIASASLIAKVYRDQWMKDVAASQYPEYGFEVHKGYGTAKHREKMKQCGLSPLHRKTFHVDLT